MNRRSTSAEPPPATPTPPSPGPGAAGHAGGDAPTFEAAIKRLTEIVTALERGDLPLEESLRLFEEGVKLSRLSQQRLDSAERRVEQLLSVDTEGRARTTPFATSASDEEEPPNEDGDDVPF